MESSQSLIGCRNLLNGRAFGAPPPAAGTWPGIPPGAFGAPPGPAIGRPPPGWGPPRSRQIFLCAEHRTKIDRPFKVYRSTTPCHHHHSLIILERRNSRIEIQYKKKKVVSKRSHTHGHLSRLRCTCRSHSRTCSGIHRRIRSPDALQHDSFDLLGCHLFRPLQIYELWFFYQLVQLHFKFYVEFTFHEVFFMKC